MNNMTPRQKAILSSIVEQYAEVASPVGSNLLAKVFGVSSATIRAEMAELERMGYILQPHTSAGRIPTDKGYRYYVNHLHEQNIVHDRAETALTSRVQHGGMPEQAIRNAVDTLVDLTHNLGIATIGNQLYMSGLSNLFGQPEFMQGSGSQVQQVARLLDNLEPWLREAAPNQTLSVYIGQENPIGRSAGCSLIISRFRSPYSDNSYIGVLGPTRQSYGRVMNLVQSASSALEDLYGTNRKYLTE